MTAKLLIALTLSLVALMALAPTLSLSVMADKTVVNNCKIDKTTGKCEFDQTYKSKNGDIKVLNKIDASGVLGGGGGGGGNASTVDQQARDRISALETENTGLKDKVDLLTASNESAFKEIKIIQDRLSQDADIINTLVENNATVFNALGNAITDVEGNQSTGGGGGVVTNESNGGATNESGGVVPPVNNTGGGGVTNSTGNESGGVVTNETNTGGTNSTNATSTNGTMPTTFDYKDFMNKYQPVGVRRHASFVDCNTNPMNCIVDIKASRR